MPRTVTFLTCEASPRICRRRPNPDGIAMLEEFKSDNFYRFSFTYELMGNGFYFHRGMFYRALGRRKRKQVYEFNCFQKSIFGCLKK